VRAVTKSTRNVLLVLIGLCVFGCIGTSVIGYLMLRAVDDFGGNPEWSDSAIAERDLPSIFGVRLPAQPLRYHSRAMGFQDGLYEVLVQLPPDAAEAFLTLNKLKRGDQEVVDPDVMDQIRIFDPTAPVTLKATTFELPEALKADGGTWNLNRSGHLLEAPGVLWLHLVAFET
jgi:hypothetical protein